MNATKRKFNALLNGMGNKSTTSLSSTKEANNVEKIDATSANDADWQAKKRRITPTNHPSNSVLPKSTLSSTGTLTHQKSVSLATGALAAETPKYAPWDRPAFLKRLKTFSNLTDWTPKPARVNEVEWAKRGWECQKFERVRCCLCNVEILVKLNQKEVDGKEEPVYVAQNIDALVDKYVELIVTSHNEDCLWRKRGCDDSIFKLPLSHAPTTVQSLRERYDELCLRKDTLPYEFNLKTPPTFDLDLILTCLPPDFFNPPAQPESAPTEPSKINKVALQLALFGWQGHTHPRLGVQFGSISCTACFRVLGLWLFKSKSVDPTSLAEIEGPIVDCLNPVSEHREYCPWRNPSSQNGHAKSSTSSLAGWEIVTRVLKNEYYLKHSEDRDKAKVVRPLTATSVEGEFGADVEDEDARSIREEKDKERWARLRRVKSLFDTKAGRRLHRTTASVDTKAKGK